MNSISMLPLYFLITTFIWEALWNLQYFIANFNNLFMLACGDVEPKNFKFHFNDKISRFLECRCKRAGDGCFLKCLWYGSCLNNSQTNHIFIHSLDTVAIFVFYRSSTCTSREFWGWNVSPQLELTTSGLWTFHQLLKILGGIEVHSLSRCIYLSTRKIA